MSGKKRGLWWYSLEKEDQAAWWAIVIGLIVCVTVPYFLRDPIILFDWMPFQAWWYFFFVFPYTSIVFHFWYKARENRLKNQNRAI